jgi:hypothetical protein
LAARRSANIKLSVGGSNSSVLQIYLIVNIGYLEGSKVTAGLSIPTIISKEREKQERFNILSEVGGS